ncbi:MAG: hypothetical protein KAH21_05445 [Spirochaetaceae bacterium]|nr:hypothetical protein [Spirochaetaceae bacterium]
MANLYSGQITIPGPDGEITLECRERKERNGILEIIPGDTLLNIKQLQVAAEELEKQEGHLKFMRKKYAEMAGAALMFADDFDNIDTPLPPPSESAEEEEDDEDEDERWIGQILMEEGDRLESLESDTGNPMSGDSITELYKYKGKFWVFNGVHGVEEEFDTYEEAWKYGGFGYRAGEENDE